MKRNLVIATAGVVLSAIAAAAYLALPSAPAAELTFALKIEHGQVAPNARLIRVMQGDTVKLELSSDQRQIVHLHGYEIAKLVAPGKLTEFAFTANLTGRFPIHLHGGAEAPAGAAHEDVLANIEVYPR